MSDTVQLIKEKLDITEFVRGYVQLTPAGKNLKGLCPFHKEKTPSFIVSPDRGTWHCFGCSIGGDVIAFLMRYENLEFIEALKVLADRAGVPLERFGGAGEKQYAILYSINSAAKDYFQEEFLKETAMAKSAREYLVSRGMLADTVREFEIGFAPNASDGLTRFLAQKGFKMPDIERAGLVFKTERGTYWDRFRGRIMFPIMNVFGKTVGFTGRVLPLPAEALAKEGAHPSVASGMALAKYVNSSETPIFNKSKLLFGIHKTKGAIREAKTAVLVEGQMDFLMAWQDGVKNVVASSGTALTKEHLQGLQRMADTLILFFDADEAGQAAMERVIDLANASDFSVKVAYAKGEAKDPADIVREKPGELYRLISDAVPATRHYFKRYLTGSVGDFGALKRGVRAVLQKIIQITSPVERAAWIRELATETHISEEHLFEELKNVSQKNPQFQPAGTQAPAVAAANEELSRRFMLAERFISLILREGTLCEPAKGQIDFLPEPYRELCGVLVSRGEPVQQSTLPVHLAPLFEQMSLRSSLIDGDTGVLRAEFDEVVRHLKKEHYRALQQEWQMKINVAEAAHDQTELDVALREFQRISREKEI
jgi:DNA primase